MRDFYHGGVPKGASPEDVQRAAGHREPGAAKCKGFTDRFPYAINRFRRKIRAEADRSVAPKSALPVRVETQDTDFRSTAYPALLHLPSTLPESVSAAPHSVAICPIRMEAH